MSAQESPRVLAARLAGSRAAFTALLCDADALCAPWAPERAGVRLTPRGEVEWSSTPLPDVEAVAVDVEAVDVEGPAVPVPGWATSPASARWERGDGGALFRFHECAMGSRVTVAQAVTVGRGGAVAVEAPHVLVSLTRGDARLTADGARELAGELQAAAELVDVIGAEL